MKKQESKEYSAGQGVSSSSTAIAAEDLDFLIRPRFGNKFYRITHSGDEEEPPKRESVLLSSVLNRLEDPKTQAEALAQLGIKFLSRSRIQIDLQEHPPKTKSSLPRKGAAAVQNATPEKQESSKPHDSSIELHMNCTTRNPVLQPLDIRVSYLRDAYVEADTAYCCLLEVNSPYGDSYTVPVLGRGSFSLLGDEDAKWPNPTIAHREHCISGVAAGFLQRAAVSLTCLICLGELAPEDETAVIDFYRRADRIYNYGYRPYLDYLVYCCQTEDHIRNSYLKYLCLEFNNRFTQDLMTQALSQFIETRKPTKQYYEQVPKMLTQEELFKDREVHKSVKGRASRASMYLKNASRQQLACCPCHLM